MSFIHVETAEKIMRSFYDLSFACPHCGHEHDGGESDTAQHVVSYWGQEDHGFSCDSCGSDFVVREIVMRSFEAAKTSGDFG